jgi:hypothetical protein
MTPSDLAGARHGGHEGAFDDHRLSGGQAHCIEHSRGLVTDDVPEYVESLSVDMIIHRTGTWERSPRGM